MIIQKDNVLLGCIVLLWIAFARYLLLLTLMTYLCNRRYFFVIRNSCTLLVDIQYSESALFW